MINLINKLKSWDGVHVEYLKNLYNTEKTNAYFFENLIRICLYNKDLQIACTWLIKHHYDNGKRLTIDNTEKLLNTCRIAESWEAKLHLLQLIPYFRLTDNSIIIVDDFARNCLKEKNKFVRAWAYNALYELTKYIPEMKIELELICKRAMENESASIKSRVKKIILAFSQNT